MFLGGRVVRGWALQLLLLAAVLPFAAATLDLLSRCRLRRLPLSSAWRALRARGGVWLVLVVLLGLAGRGRRAADRAAAAAAAGSAAGRLLAVRRRGAPPRRGGARLAACANAARPARPGDAGGGARGVRGRVRRAAAALRARGARLPVRPPVRAPVALRLALAAAASPRAGLGDRRRLRGRADRPGARRSSSLSEQLDLGVRTPLYAASLATTGVIPWPSTLAFAAWGAIAALVGAIAAGRYAPVARSSGR